MIVTHNVLKFLLEILWATIYEHYLSRSHDFASEPYLRKALRSSLDSL